MCGTEKKLGRRPKPFHRLPCNSQQTNTLSAVNNFIPESRGDAALGSSVTPVLPGEDQFSRQRETGDVAAHPGPQVQLPGQNVDGVFSRLSGNFDHHVTVEDVG